MPRVIAYEDAKANRYGRRGSFRTPFLNSSRDTPHLPVAFLVEGGPNRVTNPHWHLVDQFQVCVAGSGKFGRHEVVPYSVHYSRAYTPYGPLLGSETGMTTFTLFAHFEEGAQYFPESSDRLKQIRGRQPWQVTRRIEFPEAAGGVSLQKDACISDDKGVAAYALTMAPDTEIAAPEVSGDGQYVLAVKGSLRHDERELHAFVLVYRAANEEPFRICAGAEGLQAIIMNFPQAAAGRSAKAAPGVSAARRWHCELCAFVYDEALGLPDEGITAGTRWADVAEGWTCPDCAAPKSSFSPAD